MFLDPSERLIIFDFGGSVISHIPDNLLRPDELRALAVVGVKTIYYQGAVQWSQMQPVKDGPINWDRLDRYIDNTEAAGLKALIPFVYDAPLWKEKDWYLFFHGPDSDIASQPSYTNPQAARELDWLLLEAANRYSGRPVQFIYSIPVDGEFAFPFLATHRSEPNQNGMTNEQFVDWVMDRQRLFARQSFEVWSAFHLMDSPSWTDLLYSRLQSEFFYCNHYAIQMTHWHHPQYAIDNVDNVHKAYNVHYFCGADYVSGLRHNTAKAIEHETGLICAPVGLYSGGGRLDRWHLEEISWCIKEFSDHVHSAK